MSTTLEVILKTTGFTEGATAIKKVGDEATNTNNKLKTTASTVDQVSKNSTSLGSKLKAAGSGLAQIGTAASTTVLSVVSLQRSYRDLEDSQIAVDKTTRRVSLAQEAYRKATDAVAKAITTSGKGSKAYKQAILDQQQALAKVNIAIKDQGEAVERQGDINQNFWLSLGTTALSTSSTVVAALEKIGGEQGIGGIVSKLKGLGSIGIGGIGSAGGLTTLTDKLKGAGTAAVGLKGNLLGLGITGAVIGGITFAALELGKAMNSLALQFSKVKEPVSALETLTDKSGKSLKTWGTTVQETEAMARAGVSPLVFALDSIFGTHMTENILKNAGALDAHGKIIVDWDKKAQTIPTSMNAAAKSTDAWVNMMIKAIQSADPAKIIEFNKAFEASGQSMDRYQQIVNEATTAIDKSKVAAAAANKPLGETNTLLDTMTKSNKGPSVFNTMAQSVDQLKASFIALNQEADRNQFMKLLSQGNLSAVTKKTPIPLFDQPAIDPGEWFSGAFAAGEKGFDNFAKDSADAAAKIKKDQQDAATAFKAAWDAAFSAQVSGIDKMIAAYGRLHPKEKGFSGLGEEKQFKDAQAQLDKLMSGAITKSPAYAKQFVTSFISGITQNMTPVAAQVFQPIIDYINTHKNDAPDVFMKGFQEVIGKSNTTLGSAMAGILDQGMVQPAKDAAGQTTAALGQVQVPPSATASVTGLSKAIKAIPPKTVPSVTAKVIGKTQVDALTNAIAHVKSKTVTVTVKAQLDRQLAAVLPGATRNVQRFVSGKPSQHGYQGTVKRPTMFMAGEGGRPEDVTVRPRGSVQRGGSVGGGFNGTINVYVDGVLRPARYDMGARK